MVERLKQNKSVLIKKTKIHPMEVRMKKMKKKKSHRLKLISFHEKSFVISISKSLFQFTVNHSDLVVETWHSWTQKEVVMLSE